MFHTENQSNILQNYTKSIYDEVGGDYQWAMNNGDHGAYTRAKG